MSQAKRQPPRLIFKPQPKPAAHLSEDERLRAAREKAAEYRNPSPLPLNARQVVDEHGDPITTMDEWADLVSNRIEEAMRRGDFENLRGHGKPMRVEPEPFVPEEQQMAFRLLKNNDMAPQWIGERKEMLAAIESWREQFQRISTEASTAWVAAGSDERRVQVRESWARWLARWDAEIVELNRRIGIFNLKQPITHLEIFKLRLDSELRRIGMKRHLE